MKYIYVKQYKIYKTIGIFLLILLSLFSFSSQLDIDLINFSKSAPNSIVWNATIRIEASDGTGNRLVLGEASDASDGQDIYDVMAPPFPPTVPNINTRFTTNMEYPYDALMHEYKQYPDEEKMWNLSIVWLPEPGNESSTNITISWDLSELAESEYIYIMLQKNNTNLLNMLEETSYTFASSGNEPHSFKIVCQKNASEEKGSEETDMPFPSVSAGLIVIMLVTILISHRRKANT